MRLTLFVVVALVAGFVASLCAAAPTDNGLTPAEQELVVLMSDYYDKLEVYWNARRDYENYDAYQEALAEGRVVDPNAEYIPKLLEFEAAHHGADIGLLALWHVFKEAARGGTVDSPTNVGRREAAAGLAAYAQSELLPTVARVAMLGFHEPAVYESVAEIVKTPTTPDSSRDVLRFLLATEDLETRDRRKREAERMKSLRDGAETVTPSELGIREERFRTLPSEDVLRRRCQEAMRTLEELSHDDESPRLSGIEGVDEQWRVIRLTEDPSQPLLAEKAAAVLFKERHLKVGAQAPELEVTLLDDQLWRMADQHGKAVIVQFSFTGCGPCEQMYPDLVGMTAEFGDRLEILTLMRDETPESARDAVASGKMTWSVAHDGAPGRVTTRWSVDGFPTIYVIDREGRISAHGLRGDALRQEVTRLLESAG